MAKKVALFVAFDVTYKNDENVTGTWRYYGKLYPTGTLKVFDPAFPIKECESSHYFTSRVIYNITNKGSRYMDLWSLMMAFIHVGIREPFFPFRDMHFGYKDPFVPEVKVLIKLDDRIYEEPISIKSSMKNDWMTVETAKKHLTVSKTGIRRFNRDE